MKSISFNSFIEVVYTSPQELSTSSINIINEDGGVVGITWKHEDIGVPNIGTDCEYIQVVFAGLNLRVEVFWAVNFTQGFHLPVGGIYFTTGDQYYKHNYYQ